MLLNDITVKRRIITTLLTGMDYHNYDETMMRNGCLTLCQLRIPQDVVKSFVITIICIFICTMYICNLLSFIKLLVKYLYKKKGKNLHIYLENIDSCASFRNHI